MKCVICKSGETYEGFTSIVLERGGVTILFQNVPARICENCGEKYVSEEVVKKILKIAEETMRPGVKIEILQYT